MWEGIHPGREGVHPVKYCCPNKSTVFFVVLLMELPLSAGDITDHEASVCLFV